VKTHDPVADPMCLLDVHQEPAVPFVELAAEGEKLGKKRHCPAVFRSIHGLKFLHKVHGFRGVKRDSRALWALG